MMSGEFLLASMVFLIILSGIIGIAEERSKSVYSIQESVEARIIAEKVAQSLEDAYSGGNGHELIVEMSPSINGRDYRVKINSSGVLVDMGSRNCFSTYLAPRVTGPKHTEKNIVLYPSKRYRITHQRDEDGNHFLVIQETI